MISIGNADLTVEIAEKGAELFSIRDRSGRDYLWNGDPAIWARRAPLLFPMVGRATGDCIRVDGARYPMPQHGFARDSEFASVESKPAACTLRLASSEATLGHYPFCFRLDVTYALNGPKLTLDAKAVNEGQSPMPLSFGFHPAFRWPLFDPGVREEHVIEFEKAESAPVRRLCNGFMLAESFPTPVEGRLLRLRDALFEHDALILDRLSSRSVVYKAPDGPSVEISFHGMPYIGVWTKPGAGFVCVEPWQGLASPLGFDGEFADRPGVISIPAGSEHRFGMAMTFRAAFA